MHVSDLLRLNGASFIEAAYSAILKRQVDPSGLNHFMNRLALGDSKEAIIVALATSAEARGSRIDVIGLPVLIRKRGRSPLRRLLRFFSEMRDIRRQLARIEYVVSQQHGGSVSSAAHHPVVVRAHSDGHAQARMTGDDLQNALFAVQQNLTNTAYDADLFIEKFRKTIRSSELFFIMDQ